MLFERIRRTQKPVFIFLAVMFGLGFVALGVGQGANSIDLGSLLGSSGSSGTSISDLTSRVHSHPKDASAWLQLAHAYQAKNETTLAISAYQTYVTLRPKDQAEISATAGLLEHRGQASAAKVQRYQAIASSYTQVNGATAAASLKLGAALTHPLLSTLAQPAQTKASTLETSAITDYAQAVGMRQKLVTLAPNNPTYRLLLAQDAYATQSYALVVTSLKAYLKLEPNLSKANKQQLHKEITQFQLLAKSSGGSGGSGG